MFNGLMALKRGKGWTKTHLQILTMKVFGIKARNLIDVAALSYLKDDTEVSPPFPGQYFSHCHAAVSVCDAGYAGDPGAGESCSLCTDGYYSLGNQTQCTSCGPNINTGGKPGSTSPADCSE